jgi:hypothetical protein
MFHAITPCGRIIINSDVQGSYEERSTRVA